FVPFWMLAAALALAWNSRVATHLIALAALAWWSTAAGRSEDLFIVAEGAALLFGAGLLLSHAQWDSPRSFGDTLSGYGAFALAAMAAALAADTSAEFHIASASPPAWAVACGFAGVILAFVAAAVRRQPGSIFAAASITLVVVVVDGW